MRPLTTVLMGDGSAMFCGRRLRVGRAGVDVDEVVEYEMPLVSLPTRFARPMGGFKDGGGIGCCRSCTSDMAFPEAITCFLG